MHEHDFKPVGMQVVDKADKQGRIIISGALYCKCGEVKYFSREL